MSSKMPTSASPCISELSLFADAIGHQHLPLTGFKVLVSQYKRVFLQFVLRLAHLLGDVLVRACFYKLVH